MRLIEALKGIKNLQRKIDDLKGKIKTNCSDMDIETPVYATEDAQRKQVQSWIDSINGSLNEIMRLRIGIQLTNLATAVTITLGGKEVSNSIAGWIHRRRDLAELEKESWSCLSDRGLTARNYNVDGKGEIGLSKVRRYFDPKTRDEKVELFTSEPSTIDAKLEVVNAETEVNFN